MKMMMNTSTAILASTAPVQPSSNLFSHAQAQRGIHGARQLAHAAQHHHHEGVHDVGLPQVGPHVAHLAQCAQPASPAMPEPSANA
jgi:hypothetical protein